MEYYRPFCKVSEITSTDITVNFTDTQGSSVGCNFIKVNMAGNPTNADFADVLLVGVSSIIPYTQNSGSPVASAGVFTMTATPLKPAIFMLPSGALATGAVIKKRGTAITRPLIITYGVFKPATNTLKGAGKYKGV
jgi:hypothetical protein